MTTRNFYIQGSSTIPTNANFSPSIDNVACYSGQVDLATLLKYSTFNTADVLNLLPLQKSSIILCVDAEITTVLAMDSGSSQATSFGVTAATTNYINAQTTTAVGRFSMNSTNYLTPYITTADGYLTMTLSGDKYSAGTNNATGTIAWRAVVVKPAKVAVGRMEPRTYPN